MSLIDTLAADLAALHVDQLAGLHAQMDRIAAAEQIALRLQRSGINAHAHGKIHVDGAASICVWAAADAPRIRTALEKIDVIEREDLPAPSESLICFAGDVPVYAFPPIVYPTVAE